MTEYRAREHTKRGTRAVTGRQTCATDPETVATAQPDPWPQHTREIPTRLYRHSTSDGRFLLSGVPFGVRRNLRRGRAEGEFERASMRAKAPIAFYASGRYANVSRRPGIVRALATGLWAAQRKTYLTDGLHHVGELLEVPLLDMVVELVESRLSLSVAASYSTPDWTWSRRTGRQRSKR